MARIGVRRSALGALALLAVACSTTSVPAPDVRAGWSAVSDSGRLNGRLVPESGAVEVGRFQTWILELHERSGAAVVGADLAIGGGMPIHGHGLPTQPRVSDDLAGGRYRIEGVKLNMYGDWVIEVVVQTATLRDRLRFDLAVDF
jgi:hypothetical protein